MSSEDTRGKREIEEAKESSVHGDMLLQEDSTLLGLTPLRCPMIYPNHSVMSLLAYSGRLVFQEQNQRIGMAALFMNGKAKFPRNFNKQTTLPKRNGV